jgi:hypothetical protein
VNTCPGMGTCIEDCYARKGFYGYVDSTIMKLTRIINLLLNEPNKYESMAYTEILELYKKYAEPKGYRLNIRWNDAGDFFGRKYLEIAKSITERLISEGCNVESYAYSKIASNIIDLYDKDYFTMSFSTNAKREEFEKIKKWGNYNNIKLSQFIPGQEDVRVPKKRGGEKWVKRSVWWHFFEKLPRGAHLKTDKNDMVIFAYPKAKEDLKDVIYNLYADEYGFTRDSLKYTWELPEDDADEFLYNVIVMPKGDTDVGGYRNDVKISFLLGH